MQMSQRISIYYSDLFLNQNVFFLSNTYREVLEALLATFLTTWRIGEISPVVVFYSCVISPVVVFYSCVILCSKGIFFRYSNKYLKTSSLINDKTLHVKLLGWLEAWTVNSF